MTITSTHKKRTVIQSILTNLAHFLATLKNTAEQLTDIQRWRVIVCRAFAKFINLEFPVGPGIRRRISHFLVPQKVRPMSPHRPHFFRPKKRISFVSVLRANWEFQVNGQGRDAHPGDPENHVSRHPGEGRGPGRSAWRINASGAPGARRSATGPGSEGVEPPCLGSENTIKNV